MSSTATDPALSGQVTQLLRSWAKGSPTALSELFPLVYDDLRILARAHMRNERQSHTLQPSALVHEAYLRLVRAGDPNLRTRRHFFGAAANVMRRVLIEHARRRNAQKRNASIENSLGVAERIIASHRLPDILALNDALCALEEFDERKAKIIELRFFGWLTVDEAARELDLSVATIGRESRIAQAWLRRYMEGAL